MQNILCTAVRALCLAVLVAAGTLVAASGAHAAGQPLVSIVYSANDYGEYRPCPT